VDGNIPARGLFACEVKSFVKYLSDAGLSVDISCITMFETYQQSFL